MPNEDGNESRSPLQLFSKAKTKINKTFQEIASYLAEASSFLQNNCHFSDEFMEGIVLNDVESEVSFVLVVLF